MNGPTRQWWMGMAATALGVGVASFLLGRGFHEFVTAPRYRPSLPVAGDADVETVALRRAWLAGRLGLGESTVGETSVETPDRGNWIRIPALGIRFPLAVAPTMESRDVLRTLQVGVVRYPNGVAPGQPGVVAVAGHSTGEPWKGRYRFAFLHARKLRTGDVILIDHEGTRYTYRVTGQRIIRPSPTSPLDSAAAAPRLALISCWPLWTTKERLVVDAELAGRARLRMAPLTTKQGAA